MHIEPYILPKLVYREGADLTFVSYNTQCVELMVTIHECHSVRWYDNVFGHVCLCLSVLFGLYLFKALT